MGAKMNLLSQINKPPPANNNNSVQNNDFEFEPYKDPPAFERGE